MKTMLPFNLAITEEAISPLSGLILYVEQMLALSLPKFITQWLPKAGSNRGYTPTAYVIPIILMMLGGGRTIEDIRKIANDKALLQLAQIKVLPSTDAIGDWLRNHSNLKISGFKRIHHKIVTEIISQSETKSHVLDIDATGIFSNKDSAKYTYLKEKGYMPMMAYLTDMELCLNYEFREGNVSPATRNLTMLRMCIEYYMPEGHQITEVRIDSAGYQSDIFNYLNGKNKMKRKIHFTITGRQDSAMMAEISRIAEKKWKHLYDSKGAKTNREYAVSWHTMNKSSYFRIIVQRWKTPGQQELPLFSEAVDYSYHVICTNFTKKEKTAKEVIQFHNQRGTSENFHKEIKIGFNQEYMPCDDFKANAVWFGMGVLAYTLHVCAKLHLFPANMRTKTIATLRWQVIQTAGKIVYHAGKVSLKLANITDEFLSIMKEFRRKCVIIHQTWRLT